MVSIYLLVLFVLSLIARITTNYKLLFGLRTCIKYTFVAICANEIIQAIFSIALVIPFLDETPHKYRVCGQLLGYVLLSVPIYYIWDWLWGSNYYYGERHISFLRYFVLYLRSFNDDKRNKTKEFQLLYILENIFCPFCIGRPREIRPINGAVKIYLNANWKERAIELMKKAPIILLRMGNTENFTWEMEQCVSNNYFNKVLVWFTKTDINSDVWNSMQQKLDATLPLASSYKNCIAYMDGDKFVIYPIDNNRQMRSFLVSYLKFRRDLWDSYRDYFYGRLWGNVNTLKWKYDNNILAGVQSWSWIAFFLPAFFCLFHRIRRRCLWYIAILLMDCLTVMALIAVFAPGSMIFEGYYASCAIAVYVVIRFLVSLYWGRMGRTKIWYSEKWESLEYYENRYRKNNVYVICYAIFVFATFLFIWLI